MPPGSDPCLDELKQAIAGRGGMGADEVQAIERRLSAGATIGRDEAEFLFGVQRLVSGAENDPAWQALFVDALTRHLLDNPEAPNVLDDEKAGYLRSKLDGQAAPDDAVLELLVNVAARAERTPDPFHDYVLAALKRAVLQEGVVGPSAVEMIRRVIYGPASAAGAGIHQSEANFLFELNDATSGRANHVSWTELFVEAISSHLLDDEESPGAVDESEVAWLVDRIEADRKVDDNERALLANIKHTIRYNEIWGGIRSDDLQASTDGLNASLYSRACDGGKGGDVYYFSVCAGGIFTRIAVADVEGHGRAVSEISQWIYDALAARMNSNEGHEVLADLNRMAVDHGYKAMTTAAVITFYRTDCKLYFAYAGHPPIFVHRKANPGWEAVTLRERSTVANLPLGIEPDAPYDEQQVPLVAGDRLFLYTDGLIEAPDHQGDVFGTGRLLDTLEAGSGESFKGLKDAVLDALRRHTGGSLTHDDVTFMVVEVL